MIYKLIFKLIKKELILIPKPIHSSNDIDECIVSFSFAKSQESPEFMVLIKDDPDSFTKGLIAIHSTIKNKISDYYSFFSLPYPPLIQPADQISIHLLHASNNFLNTIKNPRALYLTLIFTNDSYQAEDKNPFATSS